MDRFDCHDLDIGYLLCRITGGLASNGSKENHPQPRSGRARVSVFALPAFADLAAFNNAVLRSDFVAAADAAAETWPKTNKSRPEIGTIAREFAWMSMLGGRPDDARTYTSFLLTLQPPADPTPETSSILHAWATFRVSPTETNRKSLLQTLEKRIANGGPDLVGQVAAGDLLRFTETDEQRADGVRASAIIAELEARRGAAPLTKQRRAELNAVIDAFAAKREAKPYQAMIQLDEMLHREAMHPANKNMRDELFALHDEAWAWRAVMLALLKSTRQPYPMIDVRHPEDLWLRTQTRGEQRPCKGKLDGLKELKYPFKERKDWLTGSVILNVTVEPDGRVSNPRALAAVPPEGGFVEQTLKAAASARFVVAPGEDTSTCRIARADHALTVEFGFGTVEWYRR